MAQPKYIYFNVRARGELPRLVAAAGGVKYEDHRIKGADWETQWKPKAPYGQLPIMIVGDKTYAQKLALSLYFARKCGLYPTNGNELELLKYDHVLQFTEEILENMIIAFAERKFQNKPESVEKVKTEILPKKLPRLEAILKANGTGFLVGNKLSIVDLSAFDVLEHVVDIGGKGFLDAYPLLKALYQKVGEIPAIKKYVSSRPVPEEGFDF